ncbi:hypothetical protein FHU33_4321 [Blastococcus colisei]|uniref:Uncharacterized protein n=1 Tax=Blastococcus colisei TaxID=1564162 RepID=A0A543P0S2_9ACTN|nr:hypothetical protein [Blastococcus colisei]TQN37658.1 hypothetical protein FHU33_4321 [Blastococcus colisei]
MPAAADDPHTRTALAAYQAGALRWLGGGVMAVVLGVLLGAAAVSLSDGGRRVPGLGIAVLVLVLLGVVAVAAGTGALVRARRWQRALASTPWRTGRLRIAGPAAISFEPEGFDELDPAAEPVRLRLLSTAIWRTRAVQGLHDGEVHAAPVGGEEWVLTAEGLPTLYGARATRR